MACNNGNSPKIEIHSGPLAPGQDELLYEIAKVVINYYEVEFSGGYRVAGEIGYMLSIELPVGHPISNAPSSAILRAYSRNTNTGARHLLATGPAALLNGTETVSAAGTTIKANTRSISFALSVDEKGVEDFAVSFWGEDWRDNS